MKFLLVLTVVSLGAITWAATIPVNVVQNKNHLQLVSGIVLPEDEAEDTVTSVRSSRQTDDRDLVSANENVDPDIYWRPWRKGKVPKDALVGALGAAESGSDIPLYMARVFHRGSQSAILSGQLFDESETILVSYGHKQFNYEDNIEILCADDPNIVTWLSIKDAETLNLRAGDDCVVGGAELDFSTFLGRTNYKGETKIGKVLFHSKTMFFPDNGEEINVRENFDILCYTNAIENRFFEALKKQRDSKRGTEDSAKEVNA